MGKPFLKLEDESGYIELENGLGFLLMDEIFIADVATNVSFLTALNVDSVFVTTYDSDIHNRAGRNTSLTRPHAKIYGTGDGTVDYFSFTVTPGIATFDIDSAVGFDVWLELYDPAGNLRAYKNYNWKDPVRDVGAASGNEPIFDFDVTTGVWVIAVGAYTDYGKIGPVPTGVSYTLLVSKP